MKISFDFDSTLSKTHIQAVAKQLVQKGFDIYITTSRFEDATQWVKKYPPSNNDDLFKVSDECGIKRENIRFTNMEDKYEFLEDFQIHLDDDWIELNMINSRTKCTGISVYGNPKWKEQLFNEIEKYETSKN